jgi:phosphoglycolate phosphatase
LKPVIETRAPRTVLLDLDGTFADTFPSLRHALEEAMAKRGIAPGYQGGRVETLRPLVSRGARAMAEGACGANVNPETLDELVAGFLDIYREDVAHHTRLMDGMQNVVEGLQRRAIPWGIVTNKLRRYTEPLMAALDPRDRAACIVSGDSTANAKPHPQPLLHACRLLEIPPADCVYVGDAENDVVAARRAGMRSIVALFGYIAPEDDPRGWRADATIDTPADLLAWIDAH